MKKINKKGMEHVSMVLSFVLFVIALVFIYLVISAAVAKPLPIKNEITNLKETISNTLTSDVWVVRIYENNSGATCFTFTFPYLESIPNADVVSTKGSSQVPSSISGNDISVGNVGGFVKVYYSDLLTNENVLSASGCSSIVPESIKKEKAVLENQILELMSNFTNNYTKLKEQLEVPSGMDFDLLFEYSNGTTIGENKYPSTEIYSKELNLNFMSNKGLINNGKLRVRLW